MAFKWLTAEEMVVVSAAWVMADQAGRTAIEKIPLLAALLPNWEKVHGALVSLRSKEAPNIAAISQKELGVDAKHDALVRGIGGTLTMLDLVLALIETGTQLGQLEEEKARLGGSSPSLGAEMQTARTERLRTVKALMANAKLAEIDSTSDQVLFSALRKAEQASESRASGKAPAPAPAPASAHPRSSRAAKPGRSSTAGRCRGTANLEAVLTCSS